MKVNPNQEEVVLRLWLLLRGVGNALNLCMDEVFGKYGITNEQAAVLAAAQSRRALRPSDLASILERSPNSVSMLVDRMVKAGLVRRTRDRKDRREVFVSATDKGKERLAPGVPEGWQLLKKIMSPLSYDQQCALADMLETLKAGLVSCLNPEMDMAEIIKNSPSKDPSQYKRFVKNVLPRGSGTEGKGREKRKRV
jgi:DNA-binding MarR family transcriptional regulator